MMWNDETIWAAMLRHISPEAWEYTQDKTIVAGFGDPITSFFMKYEISSITDVENTA